MECKNIVTPKVKVQRSTLQLKQLISYWSSNTKLNWSLSDTFLKSNISQLILIDAEQFISVALCDIFFELFNLPYSCRTIPMRLSILLCPMFCRPWLSKNSLVMNRQI